MFSELRQGTQQIIPVGVVLKKQTRLTDPLTPVTGALLNWYFWKYIIKSDGSTVNIGSRIWMGITNCAGCYHLTLTNTDTDCLGNLTLYIYDTTLNNPIFMNFLIIKQNVFDSKYGDKFLKVESDPIIY